MTYQYHDALDRYESRMRAEQAERDLDKPNAHKIAFVRMLAQLQAEYDEIQLGKAAMARRFAKPEFGSPAWWDSVDEIQF